VRHCATGLDFQASGDVVDAVHLVCWKGDMCVTVVPYWTRVVVFPLTGVKACLWLRLLNV
ncbi:MAG: hypothetical protein WAW71_02795, partial [Propioniciclava sp.]